MKTFLLALALPISATFSAFGEDLRSQNWQTTSTSKPNETCARFDGEWVGDCWGYHTSRTIKHGNFGGYDPCDFFMWDGGHLIPIGGTLTNVVSNQDWVESFSASARWNQDKTELTLEEHYTITRDSGAYAANGNSSGRFKLVGDLLIYTHESIFNSDLRGNHSHKNDTATCTFSRKE